MLMILVALAIIKLVSGVRGVQLAKLNIIFLFFLQLKRNKNATILLLEKC